MTTFKRLYNKLTHGDKTVIALDAGKSLEWISRLTRIGGEPCPAERYVEWLAHISIASPGVAAQVHALVDELAREIGGESDTNAGFEPKRATAAIVRATADAAEALLDGELTPADEETLLRLEVATQRALGQIRAAQQAQSKPGLAVKPITLIGGQPTREPVAQAVKQPRRARQ